MLRASLLAKYPAFAYDLVLQPRFCLQLTGYWQLQRPAVGDYGSI